MQILGVDVGPGRRPVFRGIHRGWDIVVSLISNHENHSGRIQSAAILAIGSTPEYFSSVLMMFLMK